jgi:2'-5' RNA ligase
MRAFIAIELPENIKSELENLQNKLKACRADVKWVAPANIHLTLKFLGEITEIQIDAIDKIIHELAKSKLSYPVNITTLGAFPRIESPQVIWAGVGQGDNETKILANELETRLEILGFTKESREFSTHITLGRVKSKLNINKLTLSLNELSNLKNYKLSFIADKITLFKSTLKPDGPVYEILKEEKLTTT